MPKSTPPELMLDNQLCFALYSASLAMTKVYKPLLQRIGLTYPQYLAMLVLWQDDGLTVSELAARLQTDPGSVTPLLKRLEGLGLLQRKRSASDERVVQLFVSETGWQAHEQAREFPRCILDACALPLDEVQQLTERLTALRGSLQGSLEP